MKARITPSNLCGAIDAPSAKSDAHRLLICAALSDAPVRIELSIAPMTAEEREIVMAGCLINYNRAKQR